MKNVVVLAAGVYLSVALLNAQSRKAQPTSQTIQAPLELKYTGNFSPFFTCQDSFFWHPDMQLDTPTVYIALDTNNQSVGYVAGHNGFGDTGKIERFFIQEVSQHLDTIYAGVLFFGVGKANVDGTNDTFWVTTWNKSKSQIFRFNVAYKEIADSLAVNPQGYFAVKPFYSTPLPVNSPILADSFFYGITFRYSNGDTIALVTTRETSPSGCNAYEIWSDGSWYNYCASWGGTGWSHYIALYGVKCLPTGVTKHVWYSSEPIFIINENRIKVIALPEGRDNIFSIYSSNGTVIDTRIVKENTIEYDISKLASGPYMVSVITYRGNFTRRIIK